MSDSTLNFLHALFQIIAIIGAVLALVAVAGTFWTGSLKDKRAAEEAARSRPRNLSNAQRAVLKKHLAQHSGSVEITAGMGDRESIAYAETFQACFQEAGWRVSEVSQALRAGDVPGLWVARSASIREMSSAPAPVIAVLAGLVDAGVPMHDVVQPDDRLSYASVGLHVGPRLGHARIIKNPA